jgi:methionine-rich copper-binding protein CopC
VISPQSVISPRSDAAKDLDFMSELYLGRRHAHCASGCSSGSLTVEEATMRGTCQLVVACVCLLGLGAIVSAHAKLEKSEPAAGASLTQAPKQIQLWFNEKLDAAVSKIEVSGPSGKVELGPARAIGDKSLTAAIGAKLADGAYTVSWQTAGDDGHVAKGTYKFSVKAAH